MNIWIYDENSYPSGFAGGHVPELMPESYNQGQGLALKKVELLPEKLDNCFICLKKRVTNGKTSQTKLTPTNKRKENITCMRKHSMDARIGMVDILM